MKIDFPTKFTWYTEFFFVNLKDNVRVVGITLLPGDR